MNKNAFKETTIPILDKGFVRLIDYMGNDERIVQAARVSYQSEGKTKEQDEKLIHYLMKNRHTSPFEQVVFVFHLRMPIFVARQWVRHRTARMNEVSGRYTVLSDECYVPDNICEQSHSNKQGREHPLSEDMTKMIKESLDNNQKLQASLYHTYLELGVARELARINLPLSTYTEFYWQMDLHNLFHFLKLRLGLNAQYEIREYAKAIAGIIQNICPIAWDAFKEYELEAKTYSKTRLQKMKEKLREYQLTDSQIEEVLAQ